MGKRDVWLFLEPEWHVRIKDSLKEQELFDSLDPSDFTLEHSNVWKLHSH